MISFEIGIPNLLSLACYFTKAMDFIETAAVYIFCIHKYSEFTANETDPFVFVQNVMNKHALNLYTKLSR